MAVTAESHRSVEALSLSLATPTTAALPMTAHRLTNGELGNHTRRRRRAFRPRKRGANQLAAEERPFSLLARRRVRQVRASCGNWNFRLGRLREVRRNGRDRHFLDGS